MLKSLSSKILLSFIFVEIVVVILILVSFDFTIARHIKNQIITELQNEINIIELGITNLPLQSSRNNFNNYESIAHKLNYTLEFLGEKRNIIKSFNEIFETKENQFELVESKETNQFKIELIKLSGENRKLIRLTKKIERNDIYIDNLNLKSIRLTSDLSLTENFLHQIRIRIVAFSILIFLAGVLLIRYFINKITFPISEMIKSLSEFSESGFPKLLSIKGSTEINYLVESINKLIIKIEDDFNELKKLERYRSEFLGNVSHELRTPIFTIQTLLETLTNGGINDPEINMLYLNKAMENLERLNRLLRDLIEISRMESKELKMSFRYFDITELISKVLDDTKFLADQKKIHVQFEQPENFNNLIWGDKERLYQVFYNLIENCIIHNPPETLIKVYFIKINSHVRFFIEDNGIGIPKEDLPRIFERFYRVNKERSRESGGTGLGLAIVKHIIEAHESRIFVESELNKGTRFYFDLKTD